MSKAHDITPAKFRCGLGQCPSIHETENGDIVFIGPYVSHGELTNMSVPYGKGESAVRFPREFIDAYFMEYAAKILAEK